MAKQGNATNRKQASAGFAAAWAGRGYEKGDAQVFWTELLRDVVGVQHVSSFARFEQRTAGGGFIDCFIPDTGVLIEQKGLHVSLDAPEQRQGRMVTPFQQALAYAESFPRAAQPRFIVVCNFATFRVHDRDACSREELARTYLEFTLEELGESPHLLSFIVDPANSRTEKERRVSMDAGRLIGRLHEALSERYLDPTSPESAHALNVLCVRLVFCLYCEDAGLFPKDALLNYLRNVEPANMREALKRLFRALNTPTAQRDPYDETVKPFPYVNGGLFAEEAEVPNFTPDLKHLLLFEVSQQTDWSRISPTIFGGIFESTLNPATRHAGGMHYTSPANIAKVTGPLFMDGLRAEFDSICAEEGITPKARKGKLRAFHAKLVGLKFLDPACGSGNFLTEAYLALRKLEDDVISALSHGQRAMVLGESDDAGLGLSGRVSLSQFYGVEINDFAVSVAQTALWIAMLQANQESEALLDLELGDFPLTDSPNIVHGNALELGWEEVLPAAECSYVMGNPPFLGARNQSKQQKAELVGVFGNARNCGNVDYVAGWYVKAARYMGEHPIRCAFVSTNSICQGEQVANIWKLLYDEGVHIDFAHDTFRWSNEAADAAHVFCVIVGFSKLGPVGGVRRLFHYEGPDAEPVELHPERLNAYLADAPDVFVWNRSKPLCNAPGIGIGNKPIDGGSYLFKPEEKAAFLVKEPAAERFFRPWLGSDEFIKGKERWVLWLGDATPAELKALPECMARIRAVRDYRLASTSAPTRKLAEKPARFHVENMPEGASILVPKVSSERRRYIPLGFVEPETFCSDLVFLIPNATLYHFGVLHSGVHNAWMRTVCGRLKSDYRYSGGVVYNNFPWPGCVVGAGEDAQAPVEQLVAPEVRERIEACAQAVLDVRGRYISEAATQGARCTMADLYDPSNDFLFPKLTAAHAALDAAVLQAYGLPADTPEEEVVAHLFALYARLAN